jgi:hypothetical protein
MLIEYRNILMSLFSLNEYSLEFFWNDLLRADELPEEIRESTRKYLSDRFFKGEGKEAVTNNVTYGQIMSRFHNPLTLPNELKEYGLQVDKIYYYHYHCAPPLLEKMHRDSFWECSLALEDSNDWRGMFLASAFVAELRIMEPKG